MEYRRLATTISLAFAWVLLTQSCNWKDAAVKEDPVIPATDAPSGFEGLQVSEAFTFHNTRTLKLTFSSDQIATLQLFDTLPALAAAPLFKGKITPDQPFEVVFPFTLLQEKVWAVAKSRIGLTSMEVVPLTDGSAAEKAVNFPMDTAALTPPIAIPLPLTCDSACTWGLGPGSPEQVSAGDSTLVCIGENQTYAGSITLTGRATLVICGKALLSSLNVIGEDASVIVKKGAYLEVAEKGICMGTLENSGEALWRQGLEVGASAQYINYQSTVLHGTFLLAGEMVNHYRWRQEGDMEVAEGGYLLNCCTVEVNGAGWIAGRLHHVVSGYGTLSGTLNTLPQGQIQMDDNAYMIVGSLRHQGTLNGGDDHYALLTVRESTLIQPGSVLSGLLDLCDADGMEALQGSVAGTVLHCRSDIVPIYCNPGTQPMDSDEDGILDDEDDYPDDADHAFTYYYPTYQHFGCWMFEDLWPQQGDYDFNDVVMGYHYVLKGNADNEIGEITLRLKVKAIGAAYDNGFGLRFPSLLPSDIQQVTGLSLITGEIEQLPNGLEAKQPDAVVMIFDNLRQSFGGDMLNVDYAGRVLKTDTLEVRIRLAQPKKHIGTFPFDPFIYVAQDRGREVHMVDHPPTARMYTGYFRQGDDDTDPARGKYFRSESNYPWAMDVPRDFDHMLLGISLLKGYPRFREFAESSGAVYPDWYAKHKAGYRNLQYIFIP